ncbi:Lsd1/2 complex PHD finger containing protein Phf2 [Dermatophagoides farinae]|uniref:Lsd1/2 complex PHD finger containing protein Phf2 n=1 Tax=Dermatophagoides farinae TaxID=6954 RepID=A0A922HNT3_DERFA|nr:Lsd1/2 complex PHD finger containing protein Phf2 [Dermatophagoides farinae]
MALCICGQGMSSNNNNKDGVVFGSSSSSITCNNCQRFIHLECANLLVHQAQETSVFYCQICRPYTGPSILKTITNHHRHNRNAENADQLPIQTGTPDFINYLKRSTSIPDARSMVDVKRMRGQQLTLKELILSGFDRPIVVETKNGLEMSMDSEFNLITACQYYSEDLIVDAIEVTRQIKVKTKLAYLLAQFKLGQDERQDVYAVRVNMSKNIKGEQFVQPRIVQRLSWVDMYWPDVPFKPLLSKYCFLSMRNAYNDFHIDVGGASAWYHIIEGEQTFYLIEPNSENLAHFEKWIKSENLHEIMFYRNVANVFKIKLTQGQTIFIPNGWIYSILTQDDTIAFGGYFLHSLNIATQLSINDFLKSLQKPGLDFPAYELTNWYAAPNILKLAKENLKNQPPKHLSMGIAALIEKLRFWLQRSKSKRSNNEQQQQQQQQLIPKAVNCSKIIRDLNRCLRKKKKINQNKNKDQIKLKSKDTIDHQQQQQSSSSQPFTLNPEETKIKDLVDTESSSNSNLKIKVNMKLAQDVIRRSMDDPYDLNSDQNVSNELLLFSKSKKKKKRQHDDELVKIIESTKREDDDYIYMDLDSPEDHQQNIDNDKIWKPGTSSTSTTTSSTAMNSNGNSSGKKYSKNSSQQSKMTTTTTTTTTMIGSSNAADIINKQQAKIEKHGQSSSSSSTTTTKLSTVETGGDIHHHHTQQQQQPPEKSSSSMAVNTMNKKYKKGLATPKQRLAKKLKMMSM